MRSFWALPIIQCTPEKKAILCKSTHFRNVGVSLAVSPSSFAGAVVLSGSLDVPCGELYHTDIWFSRLGFPNDTPRTGPRAVSAATEQREDGQATGPPAQASRENGAPCPPHPLHPATPCPRTLRTTLFRVSPATPRTGIVCQEQEKTDQKTTNPVCDFALVSRWQKGGTDTSWGEGVWGQGGVRKCELQLWPTQCPPTGTPWETGRTHPPAGKIFDRDMIQPADGGPTPRWRGGKSGSKRVVRGVVFGFRHGVPACQRSPQRSYTLVRQRAA